MRDYRKLEVWQLARALTTATYEVTSKFPRREQFGLTDQMRRAAVSVPSNIAEGAGSGSDADYARFLGYAASSLNELECQIIIAGDLQLASPEDLRSLAIQAARTRSMIARFRHTLKQSKRN